MVKTKGKTGVRVRPRRPRPSPRKVAQKSMKARSQVMPGTLDRGAREWLQLLSDPCNAPMVPACYPGPSSATFVRTRDFINPGGSVVDALVQFTPGQMNNGLGTYALSYYSVNSSGSAPANLYGATVGPLGPTWSRVRCVAACLKLRYTGTELNRSGVVCSTLAENVLIKGAPPAGVATTTMPSVINATQSWPYAKRMGEEEHEIRWFPSPMDGAYSSIASSPEIGSFGAIGNSIYMAFYGCPPGTMVFELTSVWEVVPAMQTGTQTGGNVLLNERAPASSNTLNQVMMAIGDLTRWASAPSTGARVVKAIAGTARNAYAIGSALASLTL